MKAWSTRTGALALFAGWAITATMLGCGTASADSLYRDQVSADSFGNLVVYSPSGYKRIVVGAGELASQLQDYGVGGPDVRTDGDEPGEGYGDGDIGPSGYADRAYRHCSREPVILHGRSYMYGLPRNVVPAPAGICD